MQNWLANWEPSACFSCLLSPFLAPISLNNCIIPLHNFPFLSPLQPPPPLPQPLSLAQMGRPPCCDKSNVKKGLWTPEEDAKILAHVSNNGIGNWTLVPKKAGLNRCGKSCRLRWTNYLRPDLKHDNFTPQEEETIINLHRLIGSRWSLIAKHLPGRTDNDVKNYWNTKLKKKLTKMGIDPVTHKPMSQVISDYGNLSAGLPVAGNSTGSFPKNLHHDNNTMIMSRHDQPPFSSQIPENYSDIISNSPWDSLTQFQIPNQDYNNPCNFFNEVASSSSSSSSPTFSLPQVPIQPQPQISPASSFSWNEFLLNDPPFTANNQHQPEFFAGAASTALNCFPTVTQCKMNGGSGDVSYDCGASSSSGSSFVDAILDKDSEMRLQFPELPYASFDY